MENNKKPDFSNMYLYTKMQRLTGFESYLPTAFDDTLTILEKMNKMIEELNRLGEITDELLKYWKEFLDWLLSEGLENAIKDQLNKWLEDGTLAQILADLLLKEYATIQYVKDEIQKLRNEIGMNGRIEETYTIYLSVNYEDNTKVNETTYRFKRLSSAIHFIRKMVVKPKSVKIIANESDKPYTWNEQILILNENLGMITIEGNYLIDPTFFTECIAVPNKSNNYEFIPALYGKNASTPVLSGNYTMMDYAKGGGIGINLDQCKACLPDGRDLFVMGLADNSNMRMVSGMVYISNFSRGGLVGVNGSVVVAHGTTIENIGNRKSLNVNNVDDIAYGDGVLVVSSILVGNLIKVMKCGSVGVNISQGSSGSLNGSLLNDNGHHSLLVTSGSQASCRYSNIPDCIDDNLVAYADSKIDARFTNIIGNQKNYGAIATRNSSINLEKSNIQGVEYGIMANINSDINFSGNVGVKGTSGAAIRSANNSRVAVEGARVNSHYEKGKVITQLAKAENGGLLDIRNSSLFSDNHSQALLAYNATIFGQNNKIYSGLDYGLNATRGSKVSLYECEFYSNYNTKDSVMVQAYNSDVQIPTCKFFPTEGYTRRLLVSTRGGTINAYGAIISGSLSDLLALAYTGGLVNLCDAKDTSYPPSRLQATQAGKLEMTNASFAQGVYIMCNNGGYITATDATKYVGVPLERSDFNKSTNNITENGLIIYKRLE